MTIVHAIFIVFDIPISPTFKEDEFLTESSWLSSAMERSLACLCTCVHAALGEPSDAWLEGAGHACAIMSIMSHSHTGQIFCKFCKSLTPVI